MTKRPNSIPYRYIVFYNGPAGKDFWRVDTKYADVQVGFNGPLSESHESALRCIAATISKIVPDFDIEKFNTDGLMAIQSGECSFRVLDPVFFYGDGNE